MTVKLRQRKKQGKISLYLDYYHQGKRKYEYLKLYLEPELPQKKLSKDDRQKNRATLELAEKIRAKRLLQLQNGFYGFQDETRLKSCFLQYFRKLAEKRSSSPSNYQNWLSAFTHLQVFAGKELLFEQIDAKWVEGFRDYLTQERGLAQNSALSYFNKVRAALKQAVRDGILKESPAINVKGISEMETQREFLTLGELRLLVNTPCDLPMLKRAFLFSCLTGLRFSDIQKLSWGEIQQSDELGYFIRFRQQKTKGVETLPISDQAYGLLEMESSAEEKVFFGLQYNAWNNLKLREWMAKAGILKHITFHCARHTFATLQLAAGTDIYTVSKLLGHKELRTTQVYSKVIDERKKEAVSKIMF